MHRKSRTAWSSATTKVESTACGSLVRHSEVLLENRTPFSRPFLCNPSRLLALHSFLLSLPCNLPYNHVRPTPGRHITSKNRKKGKMYDIYIVLPSSLESPTAFLRHCSSLTHAIIGCPFLLFADLVVLIHSSHQGCVLSFLVFSSI